MKIVKIPAISSVYIYSIFLCSELMRLALGGDMGLFQGCWKSRGWIVWCVSGLPSKPRYVAQIWLMDSFTQAVSCFQLRAATCRCYSSLSLVLHKPGSGLLPQGLLHSLRPPCLGVLGACYGGSPPDISLTFTPHASDSPNPLALWLCCSAKSNLPFSYSRPTCLSSDVPTPHLHHKVKNLNLFSHFLLGLTLLQVPQSPPE